MCGLTGFFQPDGFRASDAEAITVSMRDRLLHRGPDDAGVWLDGDAGIALGHRRLSVLDLSSAGHQPMFSASGRFVLAFNGEIYNHLELRRKLDKTGCSTWRGNSDTETLLAALEAWGLDTTLRSAVGMFALAVWDRHGRQLFLARDRMGEKPLYYGWQDGVLLFGSELKALRAHPRFHAGIDRDVLSLYLRHGYIPAPWSIYKGIRKLMPGTWVGFGATHYDKLSTPKPYWSLSDVITDGRKNPFVGSDREAIDELEQHLHRAIAGQRLADVPLGAFLSGGIDSSTVVAITQSQSVRPIKTFTIGFGEESYDEAKHARAVASYLGTDHTEVYVSPRHAHDVIPKLPMMYDEPFGDSSAIPTYLVAAVARQQVTVALSGDGGDELFGGYARYFNRKSEALWRGSRKIPKFLRSTSKSAFRYLAGLNQSFAPRMGIAADLIDCQTHDEYYRRITSQWNPVPIRGKSRPLTYGFMVQNTALIAEPVHRMMAQDTVTYLPDDILVKVDRAAMAVSLETRVPLLDHRLVELAWRMPQVNKVRDGRGKWLLRQVLYRHVPQHLIDRPKMGFGVPIRDWLRGPLNDWAADLISPGRLDSEGYLNSKEITARWNAYTRGGQNWQDSLWLILVWQAWLEREKRSP